MPTAPLALLFLSLHEPPQLLTALLLRHRSPAPSELWGSLMGCGGGELTLLYAYLAKETPKRCLDYLYFYLELPQKYTLLILLTMKAEFQII